MQQRPFSFLTMRLSSTKMTPRSINCVGFSGTHATESEEGAEGMSKYLDAIEAALHGPELKGVSLNTHGFNVKPWGAVHELVPRPSLRSLLGGESGS